MSDSKLRIELHETTVCCRHLGTRIFMPYEMSQLRVMTEDDLVREAFEKVFEPSKVSDVEIDPLVKGLLVRGNEDKDCDELPLLDILLSGGKRLWWIWDHPEVQIKKMQKVLAELKKEHDWLCENEPSDEFHACVVLGAMNLIEGLLSKDPIYKDGK